MNYGNRHDVLKKHYKTGILKWDWAAIKKDAQENAQDRGKTCYHTFLGVVMSLAPSGKYYMPWTTNQTPHDVQRDEAWYEALGEVAGEHDMYITSGEGDPCDLFVGIVSQE